MTQPHEIRAWLGEDWTDEQVEQITDEYLRLERQLELDDQEESEALLTAIAQRVDGTLDREELKHARRALRAAVRADVGTGMSESEASRIYGITRVTVRAWMGKD